MVTIDSDKNSLWESIKLLISQQLDLVKSNGLLIRVNGVFDLSDKEMIIRNVKLIGMKAKDCQVYKSAVDEANRIEVMILIER